MPAGTNGRGGSSGDARLATLREAASAQTPWWSALDHLARAMHSQRTLSATLEAVLSMTAEVCPGVTAAGVNLVAHKRFEPQAVFGAAPPELDALQKRTGQGPCIEASQSQRTVIIADTADDDRWPAFTARARELGVGAVACVPLWVDEARLGSLSLYRSESGDFDPAVLRIASLLATHASLAIASVRQSDSLRVAVDSRDVLGQAKGILMERFRITADEAFDLILSSSQATRWKVQRVAEVLTTTGELPAPPARTESAAGR